jgi:hypothetical protein
LSKYILFSQSIGGGYYGSAEVGQYYLIDYETGAYHSWIYVSVGTGIGSPGGVAAQIELGEFVGQDAPSEISWFSLTISGFSAAGPSLSGQLTGTSFWGSGDLGWSLGSGLGYGYGISGMVTFSFRERTGEYEDLPAHIRKLLEPLKVQNCDNQLVK